VFGISTYGAKQTAALLPDRVIAHYVFIAEISRAENGYCEVVLHGFGKLTNESFNLDR
jgi:hypothetical protein